MLSMYSRCCSDSIKYIATVLFVSLVNRLSQIGGQPSTSLDQKLYPKYELSLCKYTFKFQCVCNGAV